MSYLTSPWDEKEFVATPYDKIVVSRMIPGASLPGGRPASAEGSAARTRHKLVRESQVQQAHARRAAAARHPHIGGLDVQVAQPARMHPRQRLRARARAQAPICLSYPPPKT